jgi:hypothetical protein
MQFSILSTPQVLMFVVFSYFICSRSLSCTPSSHAIIFWNLTAGGGETVLEQLLGLFGPFAEFFCDFWLDLVIQISFEGEIEPTFGLVGLLVTVVRGHVPGVLGLAVLLFFLELVSDRFDELLAGLLEVKSWSVSGCFLQKL